MWQGKPPRDTATRCTPNFISSPGMPKASNKKTSLKDSLLKHQAKASASARARDGQKNSYGVAPTQKTKTRARTETSATVHTVNGSAGSVDVKGKGKPTIPFKPRCRVLLVGEGQSHCDTILYPIGRQLIGTNKQTPGNFSFALSLLVTENIPVSPSLLVATCYDSEEVCYSKYPEAKDIVFRLRTLKTTVHFGVDAARLDKHKELKKHTFDLIVFNFPHIGEVSCTTAF